MKKLIIILLFFVFLIANNNVFASDIEVEPVMQLGTNEQDRVWVGTFQLVWNDFMDKFVHGAVRFREGTPQSVHELNKREFISGDLSEKSYYKTACKVTKDTKKQIEKNIKKKFNETSDILSRLELNPHMDMYLIYAMLKKDFEFINAFDKLGKSAFGDNQTAEYFGIDNNSQSSLREGVTVLFYNSPEEFALKLDTKDDEEVYLYKTPTNKEFSRLYSDMLKKRNAYKGKTSLQDKDRLKVPNITFYKEKSFDELTGKRVLGTNIVITQALETVKFNMDNKGGSLKSEAAMAIMKTSLIQPDEQRLLYLNDTFVLFLKEKNKQKPYFALRVHDITKFQG